MVLAIKPYSDFHGYAQSKRNFGSFNSRETSSCDFLSKILSHRSLRAYCYINIHLEYPHFII